ncbi:MAG: YbaB/EbfC family nucleoid-associated protein [Bacteroidota bacterium]
MFGKLAEAQKKAEEIKTRLSAITVEGQAAGGAVKAIVDGNKKVKDILIVDALLSPERKEELQDLIVVAIENAMEQAERVSASEMQQLMGSMLPGLGGMFGK